MKVLVCCDAAGQRTTTRTLCSLYKAGQLEIKMLLFSTSSSLQCAQSITIFIKRLKNNQCWVLISLSNCAHATAWRSMPTDACKCCTLDLNSWTTLAQKLQGSSNRRSFRWREIPEESSEIGHVEMRSMRRGDVGEMQRLDWIWKVFLKEEDRGSAADRNLWEMRCDSKGVMQGAEPAPN